MALPRITMRNAEIIVGDVRAGLAELPDRSVHTCITSPPYWGLRDYGTGKWEGGDAACEHRVREKSVIASSGLEGGKGSTGHQQEGFRDQCHRCGARRIDEQIGLEKTIDEYVSKMTDVFREVRRVLRDDGICWINLGDSYNAHPGQRTEHDKAGYKQSTNRGSSETASRSSTDLKPKDLCGIPFRVVLALQADGWFWRDTICWAKKSPMPESVVDRCTKSWEPIFMLTKSARYFCDMQAVKEESQGSESSWRFSGGWATGDDHSSIGWNAGDKAARAETRPDDAATTSTRNLRNVWHLGPEPYAEAHFATFPGEIPRRCILASTSERGCCPECGAPWERVTERNKLTRERPNELTKRNGADGTGNHCANTVAGVSVETTGWQPTCQCGHESTEPCTVLDIFSGSGTTVMVAVELGRKGIGLELNPEYAAMSERRIKRGWKREKPKQTTALSGQKDLFAEIGDPA